MTGESLIAIVHAGSCACSYDGPRLRTSTHDRAVARATGFWCVRQGSFVVTEEFLSQ